MNEENSYCGLDQDHPAHELAGFSCPGKMTPERAGREGDSQELPVPNDEPYVQEYVIADITDRIALGIKRYGTGLQINNGRDMLVDAYEEAMDLCIYLKGAILERDSK